jgi:hypothetical protein
MLTNKNIVAYLRHVRIVTSQYASDTCNVGAFYDAECDAKYFFGTYEVPTKNIKS